MKKEMHVCLYCGRDTVAKSQLCKQCSKPYREPTDRYVSEIYDEDDVSELARLRLQGVEE